MKGMMETRRIFGVALVLAVLGGLLTHPQVQTGEWLPRVLLAAAPSLCAPHASGVARRCFAAAAAATLVPVAQSSGEHAVAAIDLLSVLSDVVSEAQYAEILEENGAAGVDSCVTHRSASERGRYRRRWAVPRGRWSGAKGAPWSICADTNNV